MLRVLQCVNYYYPSVGGTQLATHYLAKSLTRLGVDAKVITFNVNPATDRLKNGLYSAKLPEYERIDGIPVYRFPVVFLGKTMGSQLRYKILVSPSAIKMILRENPDIIHFQGANEILQTVMTSLATTFSRSKKVVTVHGLYAQIESFRKRRFMKWPNELLLRLALGKAEQIIALSKHDSEIMNHLKVPPAKITVIPNGIDLSRFSSFPQPAKPGGRSCDLDSKFVLCVTRIREGKGIEQLIEASAKVFSERPDVKFVVVGNCPEKYALKLNRLAKEFKVDKNFKLRGYVPHESEFLVDLYRRATVFVLPSLMESLPLVLLEAMASGLPIIASRVGGIPDLLTPAEGITVPPGNVAELSSSLLFLLNNEVIRTKLGQNARKKAEGLSWDKIAERTKSTYEQLLAS